MGCSPSHAFIISPTRTAQEAICLQPRIFMVSETALRLLQDVGELKFYHVDEKNPDAALNKFSGVADQLTNPTLNNVSADNAGAERGEPSTRVQVHGLISESDEEHEGPTAVENKKKAEATNEADKEENLPKYPQIIILVDQASLAGNLANEDEDVEEDVDSSSHGGFCPSESEVTIADTVEKQADVGSFENYSDGKKVDGAGNEAVSAKLREQAQEELAKEETRCVQSTPTVSGEVSEGLVGKKAETAMNLEIEKDVWLTQGKVKMELDTSA